jgi:hypothetical protein
LARETEKHGQDGEDRGTLRLFVRRDDVTAFPLGHAATGKRRMDDSGHGFALDDELSSGVLISEGSGHD